MVDYSITQIHTYSSNQIGNHCKVFRHLYFNLCSVSVVVFSLLLTGLWLAQATDTSATVFTFRSGILVASLEEWEGTGGSGGEGDREDREKRPFSLL